MMNEIIEKIEKHCKAVDLQTHKFERPNKPIKAMYSAIEEYLKIYIYTLLLVPGETDNIFYLCIMDELENDGRFVTLRKLLEKWGYEGAVQTYLNRVNIFKYTTPP